MTIKKIPGLEHYPGSKEVNGTIQRIINLIPPHEAYYELFLGKGTVLLYKKLADLTVGIDLDPKIIELWSLSLPNRVKVECKSALEYLKLSEGADTDTFIYCDPPYPKMSRKSSTDIYNYEMTDEQHLVFLNIALKVKCNCMISTYPNQLYSKMLRSWYKVEYQTTTRRGQATELLYMNYPPPTELHDYRYLGQNCWDRQRIKRKIKRRVDTLSKLPILEQKAIMIELNEKFHSSNS